MKGKSLTEAKIKAAIVMHVYQEEVYPYPHFYIRLGQFFQRCYCNDQSVKLDLIKVPMKFRQRFRRLIEVFVFAWKLIPLLPAIIRCNVIISTHVIDALVLSIAVSFIRVILRRNLSLIILDAAITRFIKPSEKVKLGFLRFFLLPADKYIGFSQGEYLFWKEHLGFSNRACYIPLGVDTDFFQPTGGKGDYIFSAGGTARDYPTLIMAMEQVEARLLLIARPEPGEKLFEAAKLPENVELIPPVPDIEYRDLLSRSRFVIVPLRNVPAREGATSVVEAMAAGKAIIATKAGAASDYITDGETGLLVEPENVDELRQKITFLLNNPEEVERLGGNARREAKAKPRRYAAIEAVRDIIEEVYHERSQGKRD